MILWSIPPIHQRKNQNSYNEVHNGQNDIIDSVKYAHFLKKLYNELLMGLISDQHYKFLSMVKRK